MHIGSGVAFVIKSQFTIQYSHSTLIQFAKVALTPSGPSDKISL